MFRMDHERNFWVERVVPFFLSSLKPCLGNIMHVIIKNEAHTCMSNRCVDHAQGHHHSQRIPGVWHNDITNVYADGIRCVDKKEVIMMETSFGFIEEGFYHSHGDTLKTFELLICLYVGRNQCD